MANSHRDNGPFALTALATALGLGALVTGCTPQTQDVPLPGAGVSSSGGAGGQGGSSGQVEMTGSSGGSGGATGSGSSGGSVGSGGAADDAGTTSSGGPAPVDTGSPAAGDSGESTGGGSSGAVGTGGTDSGSAGKADASGAAGAEAGAGTGCNWLTNADGTVMFDPAAPNKIVLFDGTAATFNTWHKLNQPTVPIQWTLNGDGTMTVVPSGTGQATQVQSGMKFENLCVHVEYMTPMYPSSVTGQLRGNSGVYLKSAYEMQILDSYGDPPDINTCGAVYSIMKPLVVACHMELVWNTYEIEFKSSIWDTTVNPAAKTKSAEYIKCALNGQVVQNNVTLNPTGNFTQAGIPDAPGPQPLGLQDHLDLVSFRNVWVRVPQY
jgi:hypothetical protein